MSVAMNNLLSLTMAVNAIDNCKVHSRNKKIQTGYVKNLKSVYSYMITYANECYQAGYSLERLNRVIRSCDWKNAEFSIKGNSITGVQFSSSKDN